jgi:hypothetical protein
MLLLSPITWGQHCVALLPAWYLVSATCLTLGRLPRWMLAAIGGYAVMVLLLARDLVGRKWSLLLGSYHLETVSMLALLAVLIGCSALKPFQTRVDPD